MTRRAVLRTTPVLALAPAGLGGLAAPAYAGQPQDSSGAKKSSLPQLDPALARAIVGESHRSLEKVAELLKTHPELSKASIDWGFGDWESALGAAAHTGQREIALLLIENGARPDIFAFAMLGHTAAVKAMVEAHPGVQRVLGPHGISLARHALAGGDKAKETHDYLLSLGDADVGHPSKPVSDAERAACTGEYVCADGPRFTITDEKAALTFKMDGWSPRTLVHQGDYEFHPRGSASVRFRFAIKDGKAGGVTIRDGELLAEATRA